MGQGKSIESRDIASVASAARNEPQRLIEETRDTVMMMADQIPTSSLSLLPSTPLSGPPGLLQSSPAAPFSSAAPKPRAPPPHHRAAKALPYDLREQVAIKFEEALCMLKSTRRKALLIK